MTATITKLPRSKSSPKKMARRKPGKKQACHQRMQMAKHRNVLAKSYTHYGRVWFVYAHYSTGEMATEEWLDLLASGEISDDSIVRVHAERYCILVAA
jgi:hypothetical protein